MKPLTLVAMLCAFAALSCDKPAEKTATTSQPAASGASAGATPTATASVAAGTEGVATEEDFEDEAEQKITSANAEEELDKLEKEIGK